MINSHLLSCVRIIYFIYDLNFCIVITSSKSAKLKGHKDQDLANNIFPVQLEINVPLHKLLLEIGVVNGRCKTLREDATSVVFFCFFFFLRFFYLNCDSETVKCFEYRRETFRLKRYSSFGLSHFK